MRKRWSNELSLASAAGAIACFVGAVTVASAPGSGGWLGLGALVLFGACVFFLFLALWGFGVVDWVVRKVKRKATTSVPDGDRGGVVWKLPAVRVSTVSLSLPDTWEAEGRRYAPMSEKHQGDLKGLAERALEGVKAGQPAHDLEDGDERNDLAFAFAQHFGDTATAIVHWNDLVKMGGKEQIESARSALVKRLEMIRDTDPILGGGGCAICRPQQPS